MFRVLLVDDSSLIRSAVQSVLEPYGVELGHADNGRTALELATSSRWDLIFLDVVMPIMDGPTALRLMRAHGVTTPCVLVTSVSTATVVAEAVKLGNVYYVSKPFTREQVRAIATRLLKLDATALSEPPRILVQHADPSLALLVRTLLPIHVVVDTTTALAQSLELVEATPFDLVIVDAAPLGGDIVPVANLLRRSLPAAGIFAITSDPSATFGWWPDEGLDGWLPRELGQDLVRGFLAPSFLRPLVRLERMVAEVAAFQGEAEHLPTYIAMVIRVLVERCGRLDGTADLKIDLTRMPANPGAIIEVVTTVSRELQKIGPAPAFRLTRPMQNATAGRLARFVLL
ncbi:MAG TPA: response regulator [Kofleriaceae bacterium]|nr:response regulator [Kofleriaceae bacterium]